MSFSPERECVLCVLSENVGVLVFVCFIRKICVFYQKKDTCLFRYLPSLLKNSILRWKIIRTTPAALPINFS